MLKTNVRTEVLICIFHTQKTMQRELTDQERNEVVSLGEGKTLSRRSLPDERSVPPWRAHQDCFSQVSSPRETIYDRRDHG